MAPETNAPIIEFLRARKALVADSTQAERSNIQKMLIDLGIKGTTVFTARGYNEAEKIIRLEHPTIIFADYNLAEKSGVELYPLLRDISPNALESIFILISASNANYAQCLIHEEIVDGLIFKPFTVQQLQEKLFQVVQKKISADHYSKLLEKGKMLLSITNDQHIQEALETFILAQSKDPQACSALYYESLTRKKLNQTNERLAALEKGHQTNPGHYLCLKGLFEFHSEMKNFTEAYRYVEALNTRFPLNPRMIPEMVRACLATKKFEPINFFYEEYEKLEEKNDDTAHSISVGLTLYGKEALEHNDLKHAQRIFTRAENLIFGKPKSFPKIIKEICTLYYKYGHWKEAEEIYMRQIQELKSSPEVHLARLERTHFEGPADRTLLLAMEILNEGIQHPRIYEIAIIRSVELKRFNASTETLVNQACTAFPDDRDKFNNLYKTTTD